MTVTNELINYINDDDVAQAQRAPEGHLITVERHAVLLGSTLAWLRASSLEDSATRADAK
jgi:hypothetical protein